MNERWSHTWHSHLKPLAKSFLEQAKDVRILEVMVGCGGICERYEVGTRHKTCNAKGEIVFCSYVNNRFWVIRCIQVSDEQVADGLGELRCSGPVGNRKE
jgi:hypothetical protein